MRPREAIRDRQTPDDRDATTGGGNWMVSTAVETGPEISRWLSLRRFGFSARPGCQGCMNTSTIAIKPVFGRAEHCGSAETQATRVDKMLDSAFSKTHGVGVQSDSEFSTE